MNLTFGHAEMAHGVPGELVWASVLNPFENRRSRGKARPAVLVRRERSQWLIIGLTTNPRFRDGSPRTPIPNPQVVGLPKPGFLWGDNLTRIGVLDVRDHIGWVDDDLAELIAIKAGLSDTDAAAVFAAARGLAA